MAQDYSRAIARVIVAQMAQGAGFERLQVCKTCPVPFHPRLCKSSEYAWQHVGMYKAMQSSSLCLQASAHESLADLLMRFVAELGTASHSYAELACRTSTNLSDVVSL